MGAHDWIIVGANFTGAVTAERISSNDGGFSSSLAETMSSKLIERHGIAKKVPILKLIEPENGDQLGNCAFHRMDRASSSPLTLLEKSIALADCGQG